MEARMWRCLWGLLCITADAFVNAAFQGPSSFTWVKVNSSVEIKCSKSIDQLMGVSLRRGVRHLTELMYINMEDGTIKETFTKHSLKGRIEMGQDKRNKEDYGFTWHLSPVRVEDTDWYYCSWTPSPAKGMMDELRGTMIIVTENGPPDKCQMDETWTFTLVSTITLALLILIGAVCVIRCKQFKRGYTVTSVVGRSPHLQHQCACPRHQHRPYMVI